MPKSPGAALAALRKTSKYQCDVCDKTFTARQNNVNPPKFCSNRCKQADKYKRSKQ